MHNQTQSPVLLPDEAHMFAGKKFLFIALESLSGDLAWTLSKEGHQVKMYIKSESDKDVYDGFVEKVSSWEKHIDWADIVVFDDVGFGELAEALRGKGKVVFGGSTYTDKLEIDRDFGQFELKRHGVRTLPCWNFSSYDEAIQFLRDHPARYVFKPSGSVIGGTKGLFFIGQEEDGKDLLQLLEKNKQEWQMRASVFILQKFVSGVEVAVGAFFNGHDFIYPINVNFEHKRVFPGDIGPFTGEMGTLMYWSQSNTLFRMTLEKMLPSLRQSGYVGYIDINCIVNGKGVYPLEFTSRFGYPTIPIQLEGINMSTGEWMYRMARGEDFELKVKKGFQIGVRILVPTYFAPEGASILKVYRNLGILFRNNGSANLDGIHIEDIKNDHGVWRIAGTSGCLLVVTGSGMTVEDARKIAYARVQNIIIPNMFYRTDIGVSWSANSDKLHAWGYLR